MQIRDDPAMVTACYGNGLNFGSAVRALAWALIEGLSNSAEINEHTTNLCPAMVNVYLLTCPDMVGWSEFQAPDSDLQVFLLEIGANMCHYCWSFFVGGLLGRPWLVVNRLVL